MTTSIALDRVHSVYDAIDPAKDLKDSAKGKVVLISGAGRGIGRAMAEAFVKASAQKLILCALEESELQETEQLLRSINPNVDVFIRALDVVDTDAVQTFIQDATSWSGGSIDVLCANAGIAPPQQTLSETDPRRWWLGFEVNVKGCYLLARFVLPVMQKQKSGHIIFTSSRVILHTFPAASSYSISKLAVARLAEHIDVENRHLGIKTFSIHPGGIVTRLLTDMEEKETEDWAKQASAIMRTMMAEDLTLPGNTCVFLASGKADFMSGRYFDSTIGAAQILENKSAITEGDLFKIAVKANSDGSGGFTPFPV